MNISPIKTHAITTNDISITDVLDAYITSLPEKAVVAITSKIVSICEGAVVDPATTPKETLVEQEADQYLPKELNEYGSHFTITRGTMIASAGIDQSNGDGQYVLWPRDPQRSANEIREHLCKKHKIKKLGIVIVDSKTIPLRWGTVGTTIAHSGFAAVNDYRGTKDLFDYTMKVSKANVAEGLGATAVMVMGEGAESTPIVTMHDTEFVQFQDRNPTQKELDEVKLDLETDLYASILKNAPWEKGGAKRT